MSAAERHAELRTAFPVEPAEGAGADADVGSCASPPSDDENGRRSGQGRRPGVGLDQDQLGPTAGGDAVDRYRLPWRRHEGQRGKRLGVGCGGFAGASAQELDARAGAGEAACEACSHGGLADKGLCGDDLQHRHGRLRAHYSSRPHFEHAAGRDALAATTMALS